MLDLPARALTAFALTLSLALPAAAATKLTWYGHSAFKIETPTGKVLLVDPWITNPSDKNGAKLVATFDLGKALVEHMGYPKEQFGFETTGDRFTMGPSRAALAAKLVAPTKLIVPMHFGTFPVLTGTPAEFAAALKKEGGKTPMREMKPGETIPL